MMDIDQHGGQRLGQIDDDAVGARAAVDVDAIDLTGNGLPAGQRRQLVQHDEVVARSPEIDTPPASARADR